MTKQFNLRNAALVTALAAVAATAWATTEYSSTYSDLKSDTVVASTEPIAAPAPTPTLLEPAPAESLSTSETVVTTTTTTTTAPTAVEKQVAEAPLTIEDRRLTPDQRIQALVMDKLAAAPNISGKIGVESHDAVVTLTGYTATAAQAQRAGRYAGSVEGVRSVQNEIRGRVGGST